MRSTIPRVLMVLLLVALGPAAAAANPVELNEAGKGAYARGDYAEAARLFGEAAAAAPWEPLYHYHQGAARLRLGRLAEARASYERALSLKPPPTLAATISTALRELGPRAGPRRAPTPDLETVALATSHGVWFAEVVLNGTRRGRFMIDTGATACAITPALAAELGIRLGSEVPTIEIVTMNGRTKGRLVSLDSIRVGETEAKDVRTIVLPLEGPFDGILGNSFLARYAVTLDSERRLLHLRPRR